MKTNMYKPIQLQKTTTLSVKNSISRSPFRLAFLLIPLALACFALFPTAEAGSATWLASPVNGDWNTATNWTAGGPPNGPSDMAFFGTSNTTAVSLSANTEVNGTMFNAAGSAFTITASPMFTLTISGAGMTNNSGTTQNFVADIDVLGNFGTIAFTNSATAGSLTAFTANGSTIEGAPGGAIQFSGPRLQACHLHRLRRRWTRHTRQHWQFSGTSTAGNATFTAYGGTNGTYTVNSEGGLVEFLDSSTAANGIFTLYPGYEFDGPGGVNFFGTSTAGNGTFTLLRIYILRRR